jgi:hypothetical protein
MMELNRNNNEYISDELFSRWDAPEFRFIHLGGEKKGDLYVFPVAMGYNTSDGYMFGMTFSNYQFMEKDFEWFMAPLYGFQSKRISGIGELKYNWHIQKDKLPKVEFSIGGQRYSLLNPTITDPSQSFFAKINPKVSVLHFPDGLKSQQYFKHYVRAPIMYQSHPALGGKNEVFPEVGTFYSKKGAGNTTQAKLSLQMHHSFAKVQFTGTHEISYLRPKDNIRFRLFAGSFLYNNSSNPFFNFRMDGDMGRFDYTADYVLSDRAGTSSFWGQQFALTEGGFKTPTNIGVTNQWLIAGNTRVDAPGKIPGGLYLDLGYSPAAPELLYNAGYYIQAFDGVFGVFFPLLQSGVISNDHNLNGVNYGQTIRFTLHLERLHLFNMLDTVSLM